MSQLDIRHSIHPDHAEDMDTTAFRNHFRISGLFPADEMSCTYLHDDRMIILTTSPVAAKVSFKPQISEMLRAETLLERRELGVFNIGGDGTVRVDGDRYDLGRLDALYIGRGAKDISFESRSAGEPSKFYMASAPAHATHPTLLLKASDMTADRLGSQDTANCRSLTRVIHPGQLKTCQLVMGYTMMDKGSVWNTMPPHLHDRRMEVYLYFDLAKDAAVFHLMGRPDETRHIVMRNEECVISPPWSIHSGVGTTSYGFIWAMAGENQAFTDMDPQPISTLA